MRLRRLICFLLICCTLWTPQMACAHSKAAEHNKELEMVLFCDENDFKKLPSTSRDKLKALEESCSLAIDQCNGTGSDSLIFLRETMMVPALPVNVTDTRYDNNKFGFNYISGASEHRAFTHKGWTYKYPNDIANWSVRKNIMTMTASKVLEGKDVVFEPSTQIDAFCALMYYVHLIGDQEEDSKYAKSTLIMQLGEADTLVKDDIFSELSKYLPLLFPAQTKVKEYKKMIRKLNSLSRKVRKLAKGGISSSEEDKYKEYAKETNEILSNYVPTLLKNEDFFADVFYE